ncbi:MAG: D-alanyl-D-alanine carboxypeptidase [Defluviitaleaceae bacterium]|nr:D-alanyl-D-alanine carboxypeptidase [Defluviitaleaceae bacterium]
MLMIGVFGAPVPASASAFASEIIPTISPSVILVEQVSGKVLYAKNEHARMYPASMTKILTSLVALDYLDIDQVLTVGQEIVGLPADYATNLHVIGETITVRNLIRALIIRSGNETGCVIALNAVRVKENRQNIPYVDAERTFCELMNEKARSLGALHSNFDNTYGFHSDNHYTTAYDLSIICRAYMKNDSLRQIAGEREYVGDSLGGIAHDGAKVLQYNWANHNRLLQAGDYYYPYATGIKTGFTDQAGDCLASAAQKNGIELVAVVFNSKDPGRWQDSQMLFEYGFENFAYETIHRQGDTLEKMPVSNPRLEDDGFVELLFGEDAAHFMSKAEHARLERKVHYNEELLSEDEPDAFVAPIEEGATLGAVTYKLDGETVFEGTLIAAHEVIAKSYDSDMDYYIATFERVFSKSAFPYWFGAAGFAFGVAGFTVAIAGRRRAPRDRWRVSQNFGRYGGYR